MKLIYESFVKIWKNVKKIRMSLLRHSLNKKSRATVLQIGIKKGSMKVARDPNGQRHRQHPHAPQRKTTSRPTKSPSTKEPRIVATINASSPTVTSVVPAIRAIVVVTVARINCASSPIVQHVHVMEDFARNTPDPN